jgi:hypothetical protein
MRSTRALGILTFTAALLMVQPIYAQSTDPDLRELPTPQPRLIGSWTLDVKNTASPEFYALQTFHFGGTMNETSDLLAQGGEGPGHGTWERTDDGFAATFELFIFNPDRTPAGRIRVREAIRVVDSAHFTGFAVADIILPDGTLIENIDNGPIAATRVSIEKVRPEEYASTPSSISRRRATW